MADRWRIRGVEFTNCNCAWGCPCQFNSPSTHGHCEAIAAAEIEEGHFDDTRLDGLRFVMLLQWPGEIPEGNGRQQLILDERADPAQREALRKILTGECTTPGATVFYVFNSTMSEVFDPIYAPIDLEIDVDGRRARVHVPKLVEAHGSPILDPFNHREFRSQIRLPAGFEYSVAEVGTGTSRSSAAVALSLAGSHAHWNVLHMNQDGVIR
jgi:hypothetical protein